MCVQRRGINIIYDRASTMELNEKPRLGEITYRNDVLDELLSQSVDAHTLFTKKIQSSHDMMED